jgi:hypothetical protein
MLKHGYNVNYLTVDMLLTIDRRWLQNVLCQRAYRLLLFVVS